MANRAERRRLMREATAKNKCLIVCKNQINKTRSIMLTETETRYRIVNGTCSIK